MEINKINRAYYAGQTGTANTARKNCDFPGTLQDVGSNDYDYDRIFETASEIYGVPAGLLKAVAETESNMNPAPYLRREHRALCSLCRPPRSIWSVRSV
jgi:soluble lytic murein transglycosylase-like protein